MFFLASLVLVWSISIIIIVVDHKNESNRWISATAFFVGLRYLADSVNELIIPKIMDYVNPVISAANLQHIICILVSVSFLFYPYALLMFSISFTKIIGPKPKKILMPVLLVPIILIYIFLPLDSFMHPTTKSSYKYLTIWSTFGIISANLILVIAFFRSYSISKKKDIFLIAAFIMPTTLLGWFMNFVLPILGINSTWRFNIIIILLASILYSVLIIKYGFLGIQLRFEKKRLDSTMKSINSGTQIISHAIKNEVLKISLCSRNIKTSESTFEKSNFDKYIGENVNNIIISADYLLKLVARIKEYMNEIKIHEKYNSLSDIIENALNLVMVYIKEKNITVKRNYSYGKFGVVLMCDSDHIEEVLNNILRNAIEALNDGGEISIQVTRSKYFLTVEIRDNGTGISSSNMPHVLDPFFSTKKNSLNFGLGLSYCYNVMQKHGGTLEIDSAENIGTAVFLKFPAKKIRKDSPADV